MKYENNEFQGYGFVSDDNLVSKMKPFSMKIVAAKINKKGLGRTKLYELLRCKGYLNDNNKALEEYVKEGYFINLPIIICKRLRLDKKHQILVTPSGLDLIRKLTVEF